MHLEGPFLNPIKRGFPAIFVTFNDNLTRVESLL